MQLKLNHGTYNDCTIKLCTYPNNRPALVIYQNAGILLATSVNMPNTIIPEKYVCIKDWTENEGILKALIENKIIAPPEFFISLEFININVCKLLKGANHVN
jgi:hypothetical protein